MYPWLKRDYATMHMVQLQSTFIQRVVADVKWKLMWLLFHCLLTSSSTGFDTMPSSISRQYVLYCHSHSNKFMKSANFCHLNIFSICISTQIEELFQQLINSDVILQGGWKMPPIFWHKCINIQRHAAGICKKWCQMTSDATTRHFQISVSWYVKPAQYWQPKTSTQLHRLLFPQFKSRPYLPCNDYC